MYAVNHTTHELFSAKTETERKVRELAARSKKKLKCAFYRCDIKGHTFSFVETYEEAKAVQAMLFLSGEGAR